MRFDIYYMTDRRYLIKKNASKEEVQEYLRSLNMVEKTHVYLEPMREKEKEDEER